MRNSACSRSRRAHAWIHPSSGDARARASGREASATVGLPRGSCQLLTGSWLVMIMNARRDLSSMTLSKSWRSLPGASADLPEVVEHQQVGFSNLEQLLCRKSASAMRKLIELRREVRSYLNRETFVDMLDFKRTGEP